GTAPHAEGPRPGDPGHPGPGVPGRRQGSVRPGPRRPLPAAGGHHPVGPDHRRGGQLGHAGPLRPLSDSGRPGGRRPRRRGAPDPSHRLLPGQDPQPPGHGRRPRGALRRRRADGHGGPGDHPGCGPQDGQRRPQRGVRAARPAGGHPRRTSLPPAGADGRDRPGQGGGRPRRHRPGQGARRLQPPPHPARPPGVRGPQTAVRHLRPRPVLPQDRSDRNAHSRGNKVWEV
ncbi:MAG: Endonuclease III, partial [uncultured Acidimicrobiales bacterium]